MNMNMVFKKGHGLNKSENNPMWKEKPKYFALHVWLRTHKPKSNVCEFCGKKRKLDVALLKGKKYIRDFENYRWLCRSCHNKEHRLGNNIKALNSSAKKG